MSDPVLPDHADVAHRIGGNGSPPRFTARATPHGTIELAGVIDTFCSADACVLLTHAIDEATEPVIDVSRLEFVDVAGMRTVATAARELATHHDAARIAGASPHFRKVWGLLGYDSLYGVSVDG